MDKAFAKSDDQFFIDWESMVFGYGYGTGEQYTLHTVIKFFRSLNDDGRSYDYEKVERLLGKEIAWLMINIFCKNNLIDYGTSPRHGWLSSSGLALAKYIKSKSSEDLYHVVMNDDAYREMDIGYCNKRTCNCYPDQMNGICRTNPFINENAAYKHQKISAK